ncbi:MAG TPA: TMEM175 family protein [Streptosporangiaceae bacterium]|nr:TMEM175 family protein [Streptosporangiaceae bacterium]
MDSRRAESFSDGVFAVAITVLVFSLLTVADKTAPPATLTVISHQGHLGLGNYWPAYLAYVVSFLTIGIMWLNHHTMLAQVSKVDRPVLVLNLFLLMGVVAIPFPTALVADHLTGSAGLSGQARVAAVTYGLVMISISIAYASMWIYLAAHQQVLGARRRIHRPRLSTFRFTIGNAGYLAGTLIALVAPVAALIIFGLLAFYYMVEHLPSLPAEDDDLTEPAAVTEQS